MKTYYSSQVVKEGETVSFNHSVRLALSLHKDSPKTNAFWTFNGRILKFIKSSKDWKHLEKRGLHISKIKSANTGVYSIIVRRRHNRKLFVSVETLAVRSKQYDIVEFIDSEKIIPCKALPLGLAYEELTQKWFLNDHLYKSHGVSLLPLTDKLFVKLNKSHRLLKCQVSTDFGFNWTTNIVSVNIKDVGIIAMLMEDDLVGPFFSLFGSEDNVLIFVIFASILFVLVTCIGMYKCLRFDPKNIPIEKRIEKHLYKEPKIPKLEGKKGDDPKITGHKADASKIEDQKTNPKITDHKTDAPKKDQKTNPKIKDQKTDDPKTEKKKTDHPKTEDQKTDNQKKDKLEQKKGIPANEK